MLTHCIYNRQSVVTIPLTAIDPVDASIIELLFRMDPLLSFLWSQEGSVPMLMCFFDLNSGVNDRGVLRMITLLTGVTG